MLPNTRRPASGIATAGDMLRVNPAVAYCARDDVGIGGTIPERQVQGMQGALTMLPQPAGKPPRWLLIDQESHAVSGSARFTCASLAA